MDDLQLVQRELGKVPVSELENVEKATGVPCGTLSKIKYGETVNPRWTTVTTLARWARKRTGVE